MISNVHMLVIRLTNYIREPIIVQFWIKVKTPHQYC